MTTTVRHGQTLLDVAVQHLGSAEAVIGLAALNALDMTAAVTPGQVLALPAVENKNKRVVALLLEGGHVPATNYIPTDLEGIEFWGIEEDFIIS